MKISFCFETFEFQCDFVVRLSKVQKLVRTNQFQVKSTKMGTGRKFVKPALSDHRLKRRPALSDRFFMHEESAIQNDLVKLVCSWKARLFQASRKGICAIARASPWSPTTPLLKIFGLVPLSVRFDLKLLLLTHRCVHSIASPLLCRQHKLRTQANSTYRTTRGQTFKAGPPWFEFLVIFDFFAPWYRRGREASSVEIL